MSQTSFPIFQDGGQGQPAWDEMADDARKHATFMFDADGTRTFYRDASQSIGEWKVDMRAAIEDTLP